MAHWAEAYIGTPWVARQSDCWHFARTVWRDQFGWRWRWPGIDVASPFAGRRFAARELPAWQPVETAAEGDGVLMSPGMRPCHVGVFVAPGLVLHSVERVGVICTPVTRIHSTGFNILGFYRRAA